MPIRVRHLSREENVGIDDAYCLARLPRLIVYLEEI